MKTKFWFLALLLTITLALGVLIAACGDDDDDDDDDSGSDDDDDDDDAVKCDGTADCTEALGEGWVCVVGECVEFAGDDDSTADDDDDDSTTDDDATPADFCNEERYCWMQMGSSMNGADTPAKASAAYSSFYECLDTANGCTGRYYDCVADCNGNAACIQTCDGAHFACLTDLCGWDGNCYSTCGVNMNDCLAGCGEVTNWTCLRDCYIDGSDCISECW